MLESLPEAARPRRKKRAQVQGVNTMVKMGLPLVLVSLLQFLSTQQGLTDVQDLHCIEFFAGRGRIAESFRERGHKAAIFERDMDHYSRGQPTRHKLMSSLNSNFSRINSNVNINVADCTFIFGNRGVHDLLSTRGLIAAVQLVRRLVPGGLVVLAPPCSSWVFMNRATSGRSSQGILGARLFIFV